MIRVFLTLLSLLSTLSFAVAQHSNQWINFDQQYYQIPIAGNDIYILSHSRLQLAGFPVDGCDPRNIQLFHRGIEQAIHVDGEADGTFNSSDFIRFFGQKNDGTLDSSLYKPASLQPHKLYNLYSDTTSYFLTIGTSQGKRSQIFSGLNDGQAADLFHFDEKIMTNTSQYAPGNTYRDEIFNSAFGAGEGWTGNVIAQGGSLDYTFNGIGNTFTTGPLPEIKILLVGRNSSSHSAEVYVGQSSRLLKTVSFENFDKILIEGELNWSDFTVDGKLNVRISVPGAGLNDKISVSYLKLRYPQTLNANASSKIFNTPSAPSEKSYLEITNAPPLARLFDITDYNNVGIIEGVSAGNFKAVYRSGNSSKRLFLTNTDQVPVRIAKVSFRRITPADHNYIIISHPKLRKPSAGYADPVKAYAEYRASGEGGSYDTLLLNIQDVYNQFNYGEASPVGIYKLLEFLSSSRPPAYLFLIGKGLDIRYQFQRQINGSTWDHHDLIPSGGYPDSDMIYSVGLGETTHDAAIATGRISAMLPNDVAAYLNKIKEQEALPFSELWRKKLLHLSGGIEEGEPEQFRAILDDYAQIAEGKYLGGKVEAIAKKSRDLEVINIAEEVNNGLSLITFFGHSSATTLDFDIGFVTDPALGYNNKGKYPVMLMNGCEAGAFFLRSTLFGENWIFAQDKGASAFIAHNSYGLISTLKEYAHMFYTVGFGDSLFIHKGIGDIQRETGRRYIAQYSPNIFNLSQIQQMILLGDPAVKLFGTNKPDLEISESQLSIVPFNDTKVTAMADSFAIELIVKNFGILRSGSFRVEVERTLSDNSIISYDSIYHLPAYADTILFVIRKGSEIASGNNTFTVTLDPDDVIEELDEANNSASITFSVPFNGTKNLYPSPFAIVKEETIRLLFQTTDLYSEERDFFVQMDTINSFSSPFKKEFVTTARILATQNVSLLEKDTVAYYWRTRLAEPLPGENIEWETSSFTFIADGNEGWAQVHFPQLLDNPVVGLVKDEEGRRIEFEKSVTPVEIVTYGASAGKPRESVSVKIKGAEYNLYSMVGGAWGCRMNTINLIAFDRKSTSPYIGVFLKWYELSRQYSCGREPFVINSFASNEVYQGGTTDIIQYVNNIAVGDSVVMFNIGNPLISQWPSEARFKLEELGISGTQLDGISAGEPFVIFGKKGSAPGSASITKSESADPSSAELKVSKTITGGFDAGTLSTSLIGPASKWTSVVSQASDIESSDNFNLDIVGIKLNGEEQLLIEGSSGSENLSHINATEFPYLKMKFNTADGTLLTPAQLDKWIVFFTPVPEGILLPQEPFKTFSINEGETWDRAFNFVNISDKEFSDSLFVKFNVYNHEIKQGKDFNFKIRSPLPDDTTHFTIKHDTKGYSGLNDIQLFVNPRLQPERYFDNNVLQLKDYVNVSPDRTKPFIEVTFDGRRLINGDFVSPNPVISAKVWDENKFFHKSDTAGVQLLLAYPCGASSCEYQRVNFTSPEIKWSPATVNSGFGVEFEPTNLEPGSYQFRMEAADESGNTADPYTISFVVSDKPNLTITSPHPNPFNVVTNFGFTLSAGQIPPGVVLKVSDITGRTVFENSFDNQEFYIGNNVFSWDGRDLNGNPLRNGVYIYSLSIDHSGKKLVDTGKILIAR